MQADPEVMRLLLAIAVFIIILAPGSAGAATYVFDEPSGSLVVTASASDDAVRVASNFETGELQVCGDEDPDGNCIDWPTAHHVTLNLTEDVELGVFTEALHPPSGSVDITVTGTSSSVVRLYCSIDATRDCAITGSGTTLDTNSDSIPDITFTGPRIRTLNILTGAGNDTINLTKFTTPLAKPKPGRNFQISMKTGAGNDTVHTGPTNDGVYLATGNDTANLGAGNNAASGTSGTKNITTGPGNDTITDNTATKKNPGNYTIHTGAGNDYLQVVYGNVRMTAGAGSDVASHGYGRAWVDLGPGNDQAEHLSGKFTGFGGAGNDTFRILTKYGTGLTARIDCGRGYDTLPVAYPHRKNCEKILYPNRPVNNPS